MFTIASGIRRSFFSQTGQFQFGLDLIVSNTTGTINFGISGSGINNVNFLMSGGKFIDNNGKFLSSYTPSTLSSFTGNITPSNYDILINGYPVAYNTTKTTGLYNYFYINPVNCSGSYNLYVYGQYPNLSVTNINGFTGDKSETGYVINNGLPIKIYSGQLTNFVSGNNSSFYFSGIATGDLTTSGKFHLFPNGSLSLGSYTGNLQLVTNAGVLSYPFGINISGSSPQFTNSISVNGPNSIYQNTNQSYIGSILSNSGSGLPILVSLSYISGTGNFYTNIPVYLGYSGSITGYISNSGIVTQFFTGIGTGQGGHFNLNTTGFSSGYISAGPQFATGNFVWPYQTIVSGFGTGINYSGNGTGLYNSLITGFISTGSGIYNVTGCTVVNTLNIRSSGPTGYIHGTGQIFYNTPVNFDKLYVNNDSFGIINNFHYFGLTGLTHYFNTNTNIHLVTAIDNGVNTITLSGIFGAKSNGNLFVDHGNAGNMAVSWPTILGGRDLGIGQQLISIGNLTGQINNTFTGSGFYIQNSTGYISGSGHLLDYTKTFTGSWNLSTGFNPFNQTDYRLNGYYNANKDKYLNSNPVFYTNSTNYIKVFYNNIYDDNLDIAQLVISGQNSSIISTIVITG